MTEVNRVIGVKIMPNSVNAHAVCELWPNQSARASMQIKYTEATPKPQRHTRAPGPLNAADHRIEYSMYSVTVRLRRGTGSPLAPASAGPASLAR